MRCGDRNRELMKNGGWMTSRWCAGFVVVRKVGEVWVESNDPADRFEALPATV